MTDNTPHVIVINDDTSLLDLVSHWLKKDHINVTSFTAPRKALKHIETHGAPDLIITDLDMPDIDGWQLCRLLRSEGFRDTNSTPILVMSATYHSYSIAKDIIKSLSVDGFLGFPCEDSDLLKEVSRLLGTDHVEPPHGVLLIDDEPLLREALTAGLVSLGYTTFEAGTAEEGLDAFKRHRPDIVILDHSLPDKNGVEILPHMKSLNPDCIVIAITAYTSPDLAVQYTTGGANAFIRKPFNIPYLQETLDKCRKEQTLNQIEKVLEVRTRSLKENEQHFRDLYDNAPVGYHSTDSAGMIISMNSTELRWLGYAAEDLVGKRSIYDIMTEESSRKFKDALKSVSESDSGAIRDMEVDFLCKNGDYLSCQMHGSAAFDESGQFISARSIVRDYSELKESREKEHILQERLSRAERMESLGILAGGIAHDLNNILGPLIGLPDLILEDLDEHNVSSNTTIRSDIMTMKESTKRAVSVIKDLMVLSRRGTITLEPLNFNDVVTSYLATASYRDMLSQYPTIQHNIDLNPKLHLLNGSESHLHQVLMNLIINACEAMPDGGSLTIRTSNVTLDNETENYMQTPAGDYVQVRIQDTGIGMSRDDISRIFEPFYSKKKMGRSGSGLGLAVVYGVIQDHHAYIDVTSREQGGTTFDLYFQRTRSTQISRKEAAMTKPGSESILVVDDNASQRKLADRLLSALGYSTACVSTGKDAVEYLKRSEVDLIVLDMVLEDSFDGLDTFKAIREFKPEQKFIVASGYSESDRSNELKTLGCRQYINKPYSPQTLSQAIRAELDGSDIDQ